MERDESLCTFHICASKKKHSWNTIQQLLRASSPMVAQNTHTHTHTCLFPGNQWKGIMQKVMQRKNVNPFKIHFLYLLSLRSFSMSLLSCEWETKSVGAKERYRRREAKMETMSRTFDSIVLCSIIVVYLCVYERRYLNNLACSWAARFAPAINSNGWIGRHLSLLFCVCCFFQCSILWNFGIYSRFRQRFLVWRSFSLTYFLFCFFVIIHIQSLNENREQLILFLPKSIFIFKRLQSTIAFLSFDATEISTKAEQLWTNENEHESKPEVSIEYPANNDNDARQRSKLMKAKYQILIKCIVIWYKNQNREWEMRVRWSGTEKMREHWMLNVSYVVSALNSGNGVMAAAANVYSWVEN